MHCESLKKVHYINAKDKKASVSLCRHLQALLEETLYSNYMPVFLCIGSDRVTGDSLGPLVGSSLRKSLGHKIPVYGTLETPVHALNLDEAAQRIKELHPNHPVIAIDASLGTKHHQGYLSVGKGSLQPGAGVEKDLGPVGDFFITGIINTTGRFAHLALQTTRLSTVMHLADCITEGILQALLGLYPETVFLGDAAFAEADFGAFDDPYGSMPALDPTAGATLDAN